MIIGIPKEIKRNEFRVAATPGSVKELVRRGHEVYVEENAGMGSGFHNKDYLESGARITDRDELYSKSNMIYKVKEILPEEYKYLREDLVVFTYLHSNAHIEMTNQFINSKATGISYEDIEDSNGGFPLLKPMSEIAGKGAFLAAINLSQSISGGPGLMLSKVHGVQTPVVTIIGAGSSGLGAAELASNFGNKVNILDIDMDKLEHAKNILPQNTELLYSSRENLEKALKESDIIINCIMWNKNTKGHLIYREDLKTMKKSAIIIDVACDEAGAIETCRATTHDDPIYYEDGICHYAVDNIPSAFSKTATVLLSSCTLPYVLRIADKGVEETLIKDDLFRKGLCFYKGMLTLKETSLKFNLDYTAPVDALK
jgi:alanine dehydrogenase